MQKNAKIRNSAQIRSSKCLKFGTRRYYEFRSSKFETSRKMPKFEARTVEIRNEVNRQNSKQEQSKFDARFKTVPKLAQPLYSTE